MFKEKAKVQRIIPKGGRRLLAVSDIHGNLDYFRGLLEKAGFGEDDELFIVGDFLEKGGKSLETLRYVMELCRAGNVHPLLGNCDEWNAFLNWDEAFAAQTLRYVLWKKRGILWDMSTAAGVNPESVDNVFVWRDMLEERFAEEWSFLESLPHIIDAGDYVFVHGGIKPDLPLEEHQSGEVTKFDDFMGKGYSFDRWVITGHWPVMLYGTDIVSANPVIDRERKIISLDGGCVLKDDGQLNALVIPSYGSEDFFCISYDPFPVRRVKRDQMEGDRSYYIRWGDSTVEVLERGEEFSRCRHVRTGYEMDILTKYLFTAENITDCNDCTDYILPLKAGDEVAVVETTSRGWFVKHEGISGWYYGELE